MRRRFTPQERRLSDRYLDDDDIHERQSKHRARLLLASRIGLLVTLAVLAVLLGYFTWYLLRQAEEDRFKRQAEEAGVVLVNRFAEDLNVLQYFGSITAFGVSPTANFSNVISRSEFVRLVGSINETLELNVRAVSFNPLIQQDDERNGWETQARKDFGDIINDDAILDRGVWQRVNGQATRGVLEQLMVTTRARKRVADSVKVPVYHIQPLEANTPAILFDIGSEAQRRKAIDESLRTKQTAMTDIISLVQVKSWHTDRPQTSC